MSKTSDENALLTIQIVGAIADEFNLPMDRCLEIAKEVMTYRTEELKRNDLPQRKK